MKVSFVTLGCRVNHYESEALREMLGGLGISGAGRGEAADICVVNTCAVTEESVRKSRQAVRRAVKTSSGALVLVTGCASQLSPEAFSGIKGVSFVCGARNKNEIYEAVKRFVETGTPPCGMSVPHPIGEPVKMCVRNFDRTRAYVKIEDGCNGKCSYCVIKDVRGPVALRGSDEILEEVRGLASAGCREVVLTGIETAAYGNGLPDLIDRVAEIEGIDRIRLGSLEPSFITKEFIDGVSKIWKFCPHFHVSIQSASDRILALMKRKYNSRMLMENLGYAVGKIPGLCLTADIIVGFPTETEEDFALTERFVKNFSLLHCHIFRYSRRPGTPAASMDGQVPPDVSADRAARLARTAHEEKMRTLCRIKDSGPVRVLSEKRRDGLVYGHAECYAEVAFCPLTPFVKGKTVKVLPEYVDTAGGMIVGTEIKL